MEDYYSILECTENSSFEEIKKKYQELALKYHPDKVILTDNQGAVKFHSINKAWNVLKDSKSRQKYDSDLKRVKISEQPPLYATLNIKDLTENDDFYLYPCRCGGCYSLPKEEPLPPECLISCDECSFNILVCVS